MFKNSYKLLFLLFSSLVVVSASAIAFSSGLFSSQDDGKKVQNSQQLHSDRVVNLLDNYKADIQNGLDILASKKINKIEVFGKVYQVDALLKKENLKLNASSLPSVAHLQLKKLKKDQITTFNLNIASEFQINIKKYFTSIKDTLKSLSDENILAVKIKGKFYFLNELIKASVLNKSVYHFNWWAWKQLKSLFGAGVTMTYHDYKGKSFLLSQVQGQVYTPKFIDLLFGSNSNIYYANKPTVYPKLKIKDGTYLLGFKVSDVGFWFFEKDFSYSTGMFLVDDGSKSQKTEAKNFQQLNPNKSKVYQESNNKNKSQKTPLDNYKKEIERGLKGLSVNKFVKIEVFGKVYQVDALLKVENLKLNASSLPSDAHLQLKQLKKGQVTLNDLFDVLKLKSMESIEKNKETLDSKETEVSELNTQV